MGELRRIAVALCTLLSIAACTTGSAPLPDPSPSRNRAAPPAASPAASSPTEPGPFDGARWGGTPAPAGALLHDDGRRLWSIDLRGRRTTVWRHPRAHVASLAASPGGRRIALGVTAPDRRRADGTDPSGFLYVLEPDGSVRRIDVVDDARTIESPVFLRAPTDPAGPVRPYWIRFSDEIADTGRLETQVMVDDGGPRPVSVPLRFGEGVIDLHGYPGTARFTLTVFRQNDVPTRFEVLRNDDVSGATDAALTRWGAIERRADTDSGVGVAWVSPTDYVVPVVHEFFPHRYELRRFRLGCEHLGSAIAYRGTAIDRGYEEVPWRILPAGNDRILVLTSEDTRAVLASPGRAVAWHAVDLSSGRLSRTAIPWRPGEGGWTWVAPAGASDADGRCGALRWAWTSP